MTEPLSQQEINELLRLISNPPSEATQAETLVQALPYIQKYRGRTIVVKYGGNAMINGDLKAQVIQDIVLMNCVGIRV
ncbi:MAG: hypothetical protein LBT39_01870, partial [Treponema sp.]|nr:hypothetical protein [Treponema sp.]